MRLIADKRMTFAGRDYLPGEVLPSAGVAQRQIEALVSARRVRIELEDGDEVAPDGSMRCATCGRVGFRSDVLLSQHLWFAHRIKAPLRAGKAPVAPPKPVPMPPAVLAKAKPQKRGRKARAAA